MMDLVNHIVVVIDAYVPKVFFIFILKFNYFIKDFTGFKCQFGPDECIGINCPNGGACQDLPGIGTKKCICR